LLIAQVALTMTLLVTDPQPLVVFRPIVPGVDVAALSVYYPTRARTREIGVRVALGATRRTVVWMIVRDGLAIAVQGVLIGGLCSWLRRGSCGRSSTASRPATHARS
jgi:hypothetical protein